MTSRALGHVWADQECRRHRGSGGLVRPPGSARSFAPSRALREASQTSLGKSAARGDRRLHVDDAPPDLLGEVPAHLCDVVGSTSWQQRGLRPARARAHPKLEDIRKSPSISRLSISHAACLAPAARRSSLPWKQLPVPRAGARHIVWAICRVALEYHQPTNLVGLTIRRD